MRTVLLSLAVGFFAFAVVAATLSAGEPSPGGHWTFDGDLSDRSGNRLDAYAHEPAFAPSPSGQALRVGPEREAVVIPDAPALRLAPGFRLACRARFAALPAGNAWADIAVKGDYTRGEYALRVNPASEGRQLAFFIHTGTWEQRVQSRAPAATNVWYDIAAGWDGGSLWLSVNGETTRVARAGTPSATWEPLRLGRFDGDLDELRVENPGAVFPKTDDIALAPGFRLDCAVLFNELPAGITPIAVKEGEYMLRLDPQAEGGRLSFFANLGGWEPRVRSARPAETGVWYRVSARWDGLELTLEVNGESEKIPRSGVVRPGTAPLVTGRFNGRVENLRVENPRPVVVRLRDVTTGSTLLRASRTERITGLVRNFGGDVTHCAVILEPLDGFVCESPAALDLGPLPAAAERAVEWRVRAAADGAATAAFEMTADGKTADRTRKTLAFFPPDGNLPDRSARAWSPPSGPAGAAAFYVDSLRGDNANSGTSPDAPWRDFTPVNGRTLRPGERLLMRRGSVFNQELTLSAEGTAQAWAEIGTYGEGARPVIRRNWDIGDRCVLVRDPAYLRVRGLTVCFAGKGLVVHYAQSGRRGLLIEDCVAHHIEGLYRPNSHGIPEWRGRSGAPGDNTSSAGFAVSGALAEDLTLRDCEMFQCSWGFRFSGTRVTVDRVFCHDNFVHNTSPHPALTEITLSVLQNSVFDAAGWHAYAGTMGIMLVNQTGLLIRNCHFLNQPDSGSHDEGGIDFEARGEGCLIERCTFRNNAGAAVEVLGLQSPQPRNVEIADSRFFRNNAARKLGPSEIFIWGRSKSPEVCCSTGLVRGNGYVLNSGVAFFTNEAPALTRWTVTNNTQYASEEELERAMPFNDPPAVDAGREIWTDRLTVRLSGAVSDDDPPGNTGGLVRDPRHAAPPAPTPAEAGTRYPVRSPFVVPPSGGLSHAMPAVRWELLHGPGEVAFVDAAAPETEAVFPAPGDYQVRLVADDGELWRSALTTVHVLPPRTAMARAWTFATPLDKEGWTDWNLGTRDMEWRDQKWECVSRPVNYVAGGFYIVAVEDASDAHLLSPDNLGVRLAANPLVAIRFQNHTPAARMTLRFTTDASPSWEANLGRTFEVTPNDTEPRLYTIDLSKAAGWRGTLKQFRLDLADGAPLTGTCRIDYIWIGGPSRPWWKLF
jgi:hypothetical protein